jgi:ketosteroid isomerase-like protein
MRRAVQMIAGSALVMATGCGPKAENAGDAGKRIAAESAEARTGIDGANAQYMAHFNAVHGDSVAALFVEDGRMMPPNAPPAVGRAAIAAGLNTMVGVKPTLTLTTLSVEASGTLAVEVGSYKLVIQPSGQTPPINDSGKYMVHWRKQGDRWMLVDDIWNSDLGAMPMPTSGAKP